jgi:hypothetical protein
LLPRLLEELVFHCGRGGMSGQPPISGFAVIPRTCNDLPVQGCTMLPFQTQENFRPHEKRFELKNEGG